MRIPPVDPTAPRRLRKALLEPLALSSLGRRYVIAVAPRIDRSLGARSGGRLQSVPGVPMLLMTHRGARSGRSYVTPLLYFSDGPDGDVVVIASNYGRRRHPAWLANVRADPEVRLQARGRGGRYRARVVEDPAERERLFGLAKRLTRAYADYERRTTGERTIQVVVLAPLDPA
ncbi:MAG TPA: nitroreductase family deazaflavin-dependent oxidoreductase [Conexibacter sp.]|nr:nitroreductase family deazaflavin-dependent oxidoreductase [Conexibacter sp.]